MVEAARDVIFRAFGTGHPPIEKIAGAVNLSVRTFQRRLAQGGRTYKMLLDEVRFAEARRALASSNEPLKAIAFELGFAEQASFTRAFRRWTGLAPSEYRKRQRRLNIQPRPLVTVGAHPDQVGSSAERGPAVETLIAFRKESAPKHVPATSTPRSLAEASRAVPSRPAAAEG